MCTGSEQKEIMQIALGIVKGVGAIEAKYHDLEAQNLELKSEIQTGTVLVENQQRAISALEAQNAKLRAALEEIKQWADYYDDCHCAKEFSAVSARALKETEKP